jgi:hypothetical protein
MKDGLCSKCKNEPRLKSHSWGRNCLREAVKKSKPGYQTKFYLNRESLTMYKKLYSNKSIITKEVLNGLQY